MLISCNIETPIKISDENAKPLSEFEKKIDANNPKEKFIVTFVGVYKNDNVKILVDGKEIYHKKLKNQYLSYREFLDSYIGDKPKQNIQIFINSQFIFLDASKIDEKRYVIVDKDSSKRVILTNSPMVKGNENLNPGIPNRQRGYLKVMY